MTQWVTVSTPSTERVSSETRIETPTVLVSCSRRAATFTGLPPGPVSAPAATRISIRDEFSRTTALK